MAKMKPQDVLSEFQLNAGPIIPTSFKKHAAIYWHGDPPKICDIDKELITDKFYDAITRFGSWNILCPHCFIKFGIDLGPGRGQEYSLMPSGRWMKTDG